MPLQAQSEVQALLPQLCVAESFTPQQYVSSLPHAPLHAAACQCQWCKNFLCMLRAQHACLQNPAACVSASYALKLVPWSCAVDISTWPGTLTCIPAYLQLVYTPGGGRWFRHTQEHCELHYS